MNENKFSLPVGPDSLRDAYQVYLAYYYRLNNIELKGFINGLEKVGEFESALIETANKILRPAYLRGRLDIAMDAVPYPNVNFVADSVKSYKNEIFYFGQAFSPFGFVQIGWFKDALIWLGFFDADELQDHRDSVLQNWPQRVFKEDNEGAAQWAERIFSKESSETINVWRVESDFAARVHAALVALPFGSLTTYGALAQSLGLNQGAARAVATAVAKNPVSFVVPCHRVVRQSGELAGYRWGLARKNLMLAYEFNKT